MQGRLTGQDIQGIVDTECVHCSAPMRIELTSALSYRVVTEGAEPVISMPLVDLKRINDPSITHVF